MSPLPDIAARTSCLPCCEGEHVHCRHRNDGPEFGKSDGPCLCEQHDHQLGIGTCSDMRMRGYSFYRCGKPAKGTIELHATFAPARTGRRLAPLVVVERCGVHLAAHRRVLANDERRRAEDAERDERRARNAEHGRASHDWAARLRDEFGVRAEGTPPSSQLRVLVEPEHLYGLLDSWLTELRAVGFDPLDGAESTL